MKKTALFSVLALLLAIGLGIVPGSVPASAAPDGHAVPGQYIIVFKSTVNPAVEVPDVAKAYGLQTGFIYEHALKGMSAVVPAGRLAALQKDPRVAYVVEDMVRTISDQSMPTGGQRTLADANPQIGIDAADDYLVDVDVAGTIEVTNMSLGRSGFSQGEYDAIQGTINKGVAFAVAVRCQLCRLPTLTGRPRPRPWSDRWPHLRQSE